MCYRMNAAAAAAATTTIVVVVSGSFFSRRTYYSSTESVYDKFFLDITSNNHNKEYFKHYL